MMDAQLNELISLAGVATNHSAARSWLETALKATTLAPGDIQRPKPSEFNAPLDELKKRAAALLQQLDRLRIGHPHANSAFWQSELFARGAEDDDEPEEIFVINALTKIVMAAEQARTERTGRPPKNRAQQVIHLAAAFCERFAPDVRISGTQTGNFARFAQAFYAAAHGPSADSEHLERQIRRAAKARSGQKPSVF